MNDDEIIELEHELRRLRPRAASARLVDEIRSTLDRDESAIPLMRTDPVFRLSDWVRWGLPLAAAFIFGVLAARFPQVPIDAGLSDSKPALPVDDAGPHYRPVLAENLVFEARDAGLVTLPDGTQARRVSSRYLDTITWRNARTNASLQWSVPREEIRVIPIRAD